MGALVSVAGPLLRGRHGGDEAVQDDVEEGEDDLGRVGDEDGTNDTSFVGPGDFPACDEVMGGDGANAERPD